jgi:acetyl esterase/lipase
MPLQLDHDIAAALAAGAEAAADVALPERDDPLALREFTNQTMTTLFANLPPAPGVDVAAFGAISADGTTVPLRWYTRSTDKSGSAIVFVHGGGMICGSVDVYEPWTGDPERVRDLPALEDGSYHRRRCPFRVPGSAW